MKIIHLNRKQGRQSSTGHRHKMQGIFLVTNKEMGHSWAVAVDIPGILSFGASKKLYHVDTQVTGLSSVAQLPT